MLPSHAVAAPHTTAWLAWCWDTMLKSWEEMLGFGGGMLAKWPLASCSATSWLALQASLLPGPLVLGLTEGHSCGSLGYFLTAEVLPRWVSRDPACWIRPPSWAHQGLDQDHESSQEMQEVVCGSVWV